MAVLSLAVTLPDYSVGAHFSFPLFLWDSALHVARVQCIFANNLIHEQYLANSHLSLKVVIMGALLIPL